MPKGSKSGFQTPFTSGVKKSAGGRSKGGRKSGRGGRYR